MKKMKRFYEEEAELGSDDEDNDDIVKNIDRGHEEENEEGLDDDLDGFVVRGDNEEIGDEDSQMHDKYLKDMHAMDDTETKRIYESIILGNNKKRKRWEVEGLDNEENRRIKQRRLEERGLDQEYMVNS